MAILDYPDPHIVSWGQEDEAQNLLGGGSHFAKITGVLEYINDGERRKQNGFDDELIIMIDSYDIWFQLPVEVLIARYDAIVAGDDARVAHRMGRAFSREGIHSNIVFGGGKRCSPNQIHTLACYPVPDSPLPMDIHGGNTDTLMGRNIHSSFRTRYLNSGYMMGPVGAMRPLLEKAKEKLEECANRTAALFDNGSRDSDHCYHGSDQSIFVEMYGEQEFHREVMRRHHRNAMDDYLDSIVSGRAGARPPPSQILDAPVDDFLKPAFTHQQNNDTYLPGKPFEFGIALDYWSVLGHQTSNAEFDTRYILHNKPLQPQIGQQGIFDCPARAYMPDDLPERAPVLVPDDDNKNSWDSIPLYTEICVGTVPVMIHHNSVDKWWREKQWDKTWWHGHSRRLLEEKRKAGAAMLTQGVSTDAGSRIKWEELCPKDVEKELFRDVDDPPPRA
ncbi:dihydroorotate dehydrogenase [Purpureocillium lavendulum]|uniref:Dihydroorotate dehydrogenase n=1 Tax=Purpureocillium lavendulum TaxID=1247861 RepID=A0AB34G903_9HYPO|nr:dihydroorotate dehydrogenase [Purpureocillium lavendulum]